MSVLYIDRAIQPNKAKELNASDLNDAERLWGAMMRQFNQHTAATTEFLKDTGRELCVFFLSASAPNDSEVRNESLVCKSLVEFLSRASPYLFSSRL